MNILKFNVNLTPIIFNLTPIILEQRFTDCGLTLHPKKTKIAYCKSSNNRGSYPQVSFDFLGHTFKPRQCKNRQGKFFVAFTPAISRKSAKKVRDKIASWRILRNSKANLNAIAYYSRAILQGWKNYYGKYGRAERWIIGYRQREPKLFVHWSFT